MEPISTLIKTVDRLRAATDADYARSFNRPGTSPAFVVYDDRFHSVLGDTPQLQLIESRDYQFAHEAGVYIRATNSVYFTANFQSCNPIELYAVHCDTGKTTRLNYDSVIQANGACYYQDKVLYCVQGNRSSPSGLVLVDPVSGEEKTLLNNFHGRPFNSINDVVVHYPTGDIWFTDPTYGYEQAFRPSPSLPCQVYRFRPTTGQIWLVSDQFKQCNGLCFSPDYKIMYVTDTGAIQAHDGPGDGHQFSLRPRLPATIYAFDVVNGKTLANRRAFAYCDNGVPDGIKCDVEGNVYAGCGDGVQVWDSEGTLIGKVALGSTCANFCFIRDGLWIGNEKCMYFARLSAKGALAEIECD